jgi:hypothetical protein
MIVELDVRMTTAADEHIPQSSLPNRECILEMTPGARQVELGTV